MKRILLAALAILLTACLSPSRGAAPQTAEPTPTATALPTATATVSPIPTFTQTPQPTPTPDVSVMTDDEKIAHVEGYDAENKFPSTILPNIVIIDDGTSYLAYDIQTGEVSNLADVDLELIPLTDGAYKEARSFEKGEEDNGVRVITSDVGNSPYGASKMENHQDGNKYLRLVKSFVEARTPIGAFTVNGEKLGGAGSYWVFYQSYMEDRTLIVYLDENGMYRFAIFDITPGEFYSKYYNL
jgi:hypothetical protein